MWHVGSTGYQPVPAVATLHGLVARATNCRGHFSRRRSDCIERHPPISAMTAAPLTPPAGSGIVEAPDVGANAATVVALASKTVSPNSGTKNSSAKVPSPEPREL